MDITLYILCIAGLLISEYVVSVYALAVYLDPEEIVTLFPHLGPRRKAYVHRLANDPRALSQVATVYKSLALIMTTVFAILIARSLAGMAEMRYGYLLPAVVIGNWLLHLVVVEYLPRKAARDTVTAIVPRYLWMVTSIYVLLLPVISLYRKAINDGATESRANDEAKEEIIERAIETLADSAGIGEQIVEEDEKHMISRIFLLDQTVVREIMVPRIDITGIDRQSSFKEIQALIRRDGHSRFPVFEESMDRILGILYVKDLFLSMPEQGETFDILKYLRKPYFVPESKIIGELLREFKMKKLHIAIVLDEYGGVAGLVTLEDILEEIVGEIQDEHDSEEADFQAVSDGKYIVDAGLLMEDLQDHLEIDYEQGVYDTVGGLIYDLVGSVPKVGQVILWNDLEFRTLSVEGQRIKKVEVRRLPSSA